MPVEAEPERPHDDKEETHLEELEEACDVGLAWKEDAATATDTEHESGTDGPLEPQATVVGTAWEKCMPQCSAARVVCCVIIHDLLIQYKHTHTPHGFSTCLFALSACCN